MLPGEQEADQHPGDLVIAQGLPVSAGKSEDVTYLEEEKKKGENNVRGW